MSIRVRRRLKGLLRMQSAWMREGLAEFLGTFILIVFGDGSVAQSVLSRQTAGAFLTINWAWGLAVAMGAWVSGGVSGGHINPAVTLTFCLMGRLQWRKLLPYWFGQYLGALAASACVYGVYTDALDAFDGGVRQIDGVNGTAGIWATYPKPFLSANIGFADQVLSTALLLCLVLAITDKRNTAPPSGLQPLCVGLAVALIGMSFGFNCGYAINPARDWGPRVFTLIAGWGRGVFSYRDYNWFWVPFVGPHLGAIVGALVYQLCIGVHFPDDEEEDHEEQKEKPKVKDSKLEERETLMVKTDENNTVGSMTAQRSGQSRFDWFGDNNNRASRL